jgi:hypothetical protein
MVNKKLFQRSFSHNDLWDMLNRSPSQRRLFDSRDPGDALVTLENQTLGKSRSWTTSWRAATHDATELSHTCREASPYKLTEWIHGHQSKIETKMFPTPYRKVDISHESHNGFWNADWSPQGRLDAYQRQRSAVEDGRRQEQERLECGEMIGRKLIQRQGTRVFTSARQPNPEDEHTMIARLDSQVRSSPHAKVVRFYHIGNTAPRTR